MAIAKSSDYLENPAKKRSLPERGLYDAGGNKDCGGQMKYNPEIHHRKSVRLKHYDYSQAGAYFIAICANNRECLFGKIMDGGMVLSEIGAIANDQWLEIPGHFNNVMLDEFVVMPNHIHGIIILVGATLVVAQNNRAGTSPAPTIGNIIGAFKSFCVNQLIKNRLCAGKLWQRNYYEHIIRNETELNKIREYIINNPVNWKTDENYKN